MPRIFHAPALPIALLALSLASSAIATPHVCHDEYSRLYEESGARRFHEAIRKPQSRSDEQILIDSVEYQLNREIERLHLLGKTWAKRDFNKIMQASLEEMARTLEAASAQEGRPIRFRDLRPDTRKKIVASVVDGALSPYANVITLKGLGLSILGPVTVTAGVKLIDQKIPGFDDFTKSLYYSVAGALAWPLAVRVESFTTLWASKSNKSSSGSSDPMDKYLEKISQDRVKRVSDVAQDGRSSRAQAMGSLHDALEDGLDMKSREDVLYTIANAVTDLVRTYREMETVDPLWSERVFLQLHNAGLHNAEAYQSILGYLRDTCKAAAIDFDKVKRRLDAFYRPDPRWTAEPREVASQAPKLIAAKSLEEPPPPWDVRMRHLDVEFALHRQIKTVHFFGRTRAMRDFEILRKAVITELHNTLKEMSTQLGHRVLYTDLDKEARAAMIDEMIESLLGEYESTLTAKGLAVSLFGSPGVHLGVKLIDHGMGLLGVPIKVAPFVGSIENPVAVGLSAPVVSQRLGPMVKQWAAADNRSSGDPGGPFERFTTQLGQERHKRVNNIVNDGRNLRYQSMSILRRILHDASGLKTLSARQLMVANGITESVRGYREIEGMDPLWLDRVRRKIADMGLHNRDSYRIIRGLLPTYAESSQVSLDRLTARLDLIFTPEPEWLTP